MFLDISQAFNKVWYEDLIFKLKLYAKNLTRKVLKCQVWNFSNTSAGKKRYAPFTKYERTTSKISF